MMGVNPNWYGFIYTEQKNKTFISYSVTYGCDFLCDYLIISSIAVMAVVEEL